MECNFDWKLKMQWKIYNIIADWWNNYINISVLNKIQSYIFKNVNITQNFICIDKGLQSNLAHIWITQRKLKAENWVILN